MKKIIITLIILLNIIISNKLVFAQNNIYNIYKNNVEENCLQANFYINEDKWNKYVYKYEKYQKYYPQVSELKWNKLNTIKQIYRNTQNNIYKCWLISAQMNWMNIILKNLDLDKTWIMKNLVKNKLKPKIEKLKRINKDCKFNNNNIQISKKQILDQSTFELCKYEYYLDYLNNYYSNISNLTESDNKSTYNSNELAKLESWYKNAINTEKQHSYEVYPMVFNAYSQYQNYFPIHIALEFLKDNLKEYRDLLYKAINPINQVVYKIINAMSK